MAIHTFEDITYELHLSDQRRSIGLVVERDGHLVVKAPTDCGVACVERLLDRKRPWIYAKLATKQALAGSAPAREIRNGQGFLYLGRSYQLSIIADGTGPELPLALRHGRFELLQSAVPEGREHFVRWYSVRGQEKLGERVAIYRDRLAVKPTAVRVRDLGHRWGSCGKNGALYFHWRLAMAPIRVVDYVVVHEMLHLREPKHSEEFRAGMRRVLPDWELREAWLTSHGAGLAV